MAASTTYSVGHKEVPTLGNSASKVSLNPKLLAEAERNLTFKQKRALKEQKVLDLIRSRPAGSRIGLRDFARVLMTSEPSAHEFIKGMVKRGKISKHNLSPKTFYYAILDDAKTVTPTEEKPIEEPKAELTSNPNAAPTPPMPSSHHLDIDIERKAMQYSWETPDDNNNLRGFIEWYKKNAWEQQRDENQ